MQRDFIFPCNYGFDFLHTHTHTHKEQNSLNFNFQKAKHRNVFHKKELQFLAFNAVHIIV
jgi:hypothetical protein